MNSDWSVFVKAMIGVCAVMILMLLFVDMGKQIGQLQGLCHAYNGTVRVDPVVSCELPNGSVIEAHEVNV